LDFLDDFFPSWEAQALLRRASLLLPKPLCSDSGCFFVLSAKNFAESPFGSAAGLGVQRQIFSSVVASRPLRV